MDKVWIVSTGEYSDWRIERIFSNKEAADDYAKTFEKKHYSHEAADVREWDVDATFDKDSVFWEVTFWREGNTLTHIADREEKLPEGVVLGRVDYRNYYNEHCCWSVWVRNPNEQGALKAAAEIVDQYRAEQAGIA